VAGVRRCGVVSVCECVGRVEEVSLGVQLCSGSWRGSIIIIEHLPG
jgi:hypothetical protein